MLNRKDFKEFRWVSKVNVLVVCQFFENIIFNYFCSFIKVMKTRKKVFFLLIICCFASCKSAFYKQEVGIKNNNEVNYIPYYLEMYKADSLFLAKNYMQSYKILDKLFKKYPPHNTEGYYEYSNYLASAVMSRYNKNYKEKVIYGLKKFGSVMPYHKEAFKLKDSILNTSGLTEKEITIYSEEYKSNINWELRKQLEQIAEEDTFIRFKKTKGQERIDEFAKYSQLHKEQLKRIFTNYGFPTFQLIGSDNDSDKTARIFAVIMHQDTKQIREWLPMLYQELLKGNIEPNDYASVYDRMLWIECLENKSTVQQYYGSLTKSFTDPTFSPPVQNPTKIDSLRESIGLFNRGYNVWREKMVK